MKLKSITLLLIFASAMSANANMEEKRKDFKARFQKLEEARQAKIMADRRAKEKRMEQMVASYLKSEINFTKETIFQFLESKNEVVLNDNTKESLEFVIGDDMREFMGEKYLFTQPLNKYLNYTSDVQLETENYICSGRLSLSNNFTETTIYGLESEEHVRTKLRRTMVECMHKNEGENFVFNQSFVDKINNDKEEAEAQRLKEIRNKQINVISVGRAL